MATKTVTLKDSNGDTLYPVTDSNVVNINQQKTLAQALDGVVYAEDPTTAVTPAPWVTSSDIDWSTMFQPDDVTIGFAGNSKTAKKFHVGGNIYAITFHGQTGATSASGGARQITITYPKFSNILCAFVKYTVSGQTSPGTGHSSFGAQSADTYVYPNEQAGSMVIADLLILGELSSS